MDLFKIIPPSATEVPIVISIPHAGTKFPPDIKHRYKKKMRRHLDDTDWDVHRLYDFAPELGITIIKANLSRWVVDLNRDPESRPLYDDNRLITGVCPTTDFFGNSLYKSPELEPSTSDREQRLKTYYQPYHENIESLLSEKKKKFGQALLWDAHSIRHYVGSIQHDPFPDMILGNDNEKTAHPKLIQTALESLKSGDFEVCHNAPFKGGHITRHFGNPKEHVHALQLEMNKILYMDDNEITYNAERAQKVKVLLRKTLQNLIDTLPTIL